jgi:dihydrolipoamide dehydrogenase
VKLDDKGFVVVDDQMQTNVAGIWAIGDVTGRLLLAHAASAMGILCAEKIKGEEASPINFKMIPSATYCHPQIASFGMTEKEVKESGREYAIGSFPFQPNGKALGLGESDGFVKIIIDPKFGEILGAHLIGPEVSELIGELTLAQSSELTINEIANNIHSHPTLSEAIMEAAEQTLGRAIHI